MAPAETRPQILQHLGKVILHQRNNTDCLLLNVAMTSQREKQHTQCGQNVLLNVAVTSQRGQQKNKKQTTFTYFSNASSNAKRIKVKWFPEAVVDKFPLWFHSAVRCGSSRQSRLRAESVWQPDSLQVRACVCLRACTPVHSACQLGSRRPARGSTSNRVSVQNHNTARFPGVGKPLHTTTPALTTEQQWQRINQRLTASHNRWLSLEVGVVNGTS